jgi:hypothetical protein
MSNARSRRAGPRRIGSLTQIRGEQIRHLTRVHRRTEQAGRFCDSRSGASTGPFLTARNTLSVSPTQGNRISSKSLGSILPRQTRRTQVSASG